jgi:hypothetical protein
MLHHKNSNLVKINGIKKTPLVDYYEIGQISMGEKNKM